MKGEECMKSLGLWPNLYVVWLYFCQTYVGISLIHFIDACTAHPFLHPTSIAAASFGGAIAMFFLNRESWLSWIREPLEKTRHP